MVWGNFSKFWIKFYENLYIIFFFKKKNKILYKKIYLIIDIILDFIKI